MGTGRPDWYGNQIVTGKYNTSFIPILVDENGNILVIAKGDYAGELATIALDEDGRLLTNISRQGLDFLRVRPVYGEMKKNSGSLDIASGAGLVQLFSVSGRGAIIGGYVFWIKGGSTQASVALYVDGVQVINVTPGYLAAHNLNQGCDFPVRGLVCDSVTPQYDISFREGITFESSFSVSVAQVIGITVQFVWIVCYALVPT